MACVVRRILAEIVSRCHLDSVGDGRAAALQLGLLDGVVEALHGLDAGLDIRRRPARLGGVQDAGAAMTGAADDPGGSAGASGQEGVKS